MDIQSQLRGFTVKRNEIVAQMEDIMRLAAEDDRTLDDEEQAQYDGLRTERKAVDGHIERLEELVSDDTKKTTAVKGQAPGILIKRADPDEKFQGQNFTRKIIAKTLAFQSQGSMSPGQIAQNRWGKSNPELVKVIKSGVEYDVERVQKLGEIEGGGSGTGEWGAELVSADNRYMGDFIEFLYAATVYNRLPLRTVPANVTIKGQDGAATGFWVGESLAIPPSAQSFSTVSLTPLKVAAISVISNELIRDSSPSAEMLVRDSLVEAAAQRIDSTFIGDGAASAGVSPAGILNGVTADVASGTDAAALRADIKTLYAGFLSAKNARGLYMVTTPTLAKSISLMVNALGQPEFPGMTAEGGTLLGDPIITGDNVGTGDLILLKPSDIYRIEAGGLQVSVSQDATLEQNDTPLGDSQTPVAASAGDVAVSSSRFLGGSLLLDSVDLDSIAALTGTNSSNSGTPRMKPSSGTSPSSRGVDQRSTSLLSPDSNVRSASR